MEFSLSNEQEMIIDSVRSFVEQELYPHEEEVEKTNHIDKVWQRASNKKRLTLVFMLPTCLWNMVVVVSIH